MTRNKHAKGACLMAYDLELDKKFKSVENFTIIFNQGKPLCV